MGKKTKQKATLERKVDRRVELAPIGREVPEVVRADERDDLDDLDDLEDRDERDVHLNAVSVSAPRIPVPSGLRS